MKNNKGFSIVELIVSFSICIAIVITLFQIVIVLKEVYEKAEIKTALLNKQNILVDLIYEDILDKKLKAYNCSTGVYTSCETLTIEFQDNSSKQLSYSSTNKTITYGDYTTPVIGGSIVSDMSVTLNGNVLTISIPINHKLFKETDNFGVYITHYLINE